MSQVLPGNRSCLRHAGNLAHGHPGRVQRRRAHVEILQNFTNAILKNEKLLSPAEEGIRSVELANSILLSTWKDATIHLPMDSAEYERILKDKSENSTFVKKTVAPKASADDFAKSFR